MKKKAIPTHRSCTVKYTNIDSAYMGQLLEWPEVIIEGKTLKDCRAMLRDALHEMILAYQQDYQGIPERSCLLEAIPVKL